MYMVVTKIKVLKSHLRDWNVNVFGNVYEQIAKARKHLAEIQQKIVEVGATSELLQDECEAKIYSLT